MKIRVDSEGLGVSRGEVERKRTAGGKERRVVNVVDGAKVSRCALTRTRTRTVLVADKSLAIRSIDR